MTYPKALKHLDLNRLSPLYLVSGEEPFLIQKTLDQFREKAIDSAVRDFNYDLFQGEAVAPEEILLIAQTFPVASARRLIIIQNADLIKDDRELFPAYFENPLETTVLVFVAAKPDLRRKLFVALKKKGTLITCPPLYDNEISRWITQEGEKKGLRFSQEALWYLKERLGKELFLIEQELNKLASHLEAGTLPAAPRPGPLSGGPAYPPAAGREVSLKVAQEVVGGGRGHSIFELTRAVGEKNLKGALNLLASLLSEGERPLPILAMLTRQWRMMAIAQEGLYAGESESVVGKKIGLPPFFLSAFLRQLKHWKRDEIRKAFDLSLAADSQLKGGRQSASFVLEALLLELCRTEPSPKRAKGYLIPFRD